MPSVKFPKYIDYDQLLAASSPQQTSDLTLENKQPICAPIIIPDEEIDLEETTLIPVGLTGTKLRSYAFAVLTRKEYSRIDLIEKLMLRAQNRDEVITLVEEFAAANYQSDDRMAEMVVRSQVRKGKGPQRIKLALKSKSLDIAHVNEDLKEIDWLAQAYALKVKKYGVDVAKEPKLKAKQIRFLQYRGFDLDVIFKAISRKP